MRNGARAGTPPLARSQHPAYREAPRVIIEIPLESRARLRIVADCHEDELRLRAWLRSALSRRVALSAELVRWLDALDDADRERLAA